MYLNATHNHWSEVTLSGLTIAGVRHAALEAGGDAGIDGAIDDVVLTDSKVGLDAWSPLDFLLTACTAHGNELTGDRQFEALAESCVDTDPDFGDLSVPAGPDGRFFTPDDPWVSSTGGARPTAVASRR